MDKNHLILSITDSKEYKQDSLTSVLLEPRMCLLGDENEEQDPDEGHPDAEGPDLASGFEPRRHLAHEALARCRPSILSRGDGVISP